MNGELVYEPDTNQLDFPFTRRLSSSGLRAVVMAQLSSESSCFGILLAARRQPDSFTISDCEFFRQLSQHVALAAQQSELYAASQEANEKLEARISERTADLVSTNNELEAFAYSVSHDLRAPLRHLDGFANLLRRNCYQRLDGPAQRYLDKITAAGQRMGSLIDDLLAFSRLGRSDISRTQVSLQLLQDEVRHELEPDLAGRTVVWIIGELPDVYGDRSMLRQVFVNLLSNAVKYTRDRPEGRIEMGCSATTEQEATIFVRDNGTGFEMQYVHKLFGVFQRLHSDEFEGNGVGLANVRRIVERHGGRVWAEGAVDQGATFYCSLQLNRGKAHD